MAIIVFEVPHPLPNQDGIFVVRESDIVGLGGRGGSARTGWTRLLYLAGRHSITICNTAENIRAVLRAFNGVSNTGQTPLNRVNIEDIVDTLMSPQNRSAQTAPATPTTLESIFSPQPTRAATGPVSNNDGDGDEDSDSDSDSDSSDSDAEDEEAEDDPPDWADDDGDDGN